MNTFSKFIALLLVGVLTSSSWAQTWAPGSQGWEYNPGPNPATPEGRALVDIYAELPEYMTLSDQLMAAQKFRYIFGTMLTRTYFDKNAVKVLFIGQDATHIAEAAKQPGTSGFGARVQSIGNFFGVDQSVATTNAFLSTIKGQYGSFDHPYVEIDQTGKAEIKQSAFVSNELWAISNDHLSEIVVKREAFWEWMIKNNPESLRLMVMFGGAARDAFAEFLIARGAKVGTRMNPERLKNIRVPETKLAYAGGNNEFPVPVNAEGKDIYEIILGRKPDYSKPEDQQAAQKALKEAGQKAIDMMVFTLGGVEKSGIMNAAQLGGYNLDDVTINGEKTNSIKGLVLSDGFVVKENLAFTMSPHPTALSKMTPLDASATLKKAFDRLNDQKKRGWFIEPDLDDSGKPRVNAWDAGKDYEYGRADIRAGYFEFGAPDDRRVSRADASRLDPQTIVAGTRDRAKFDDALLNAAKSALPSEKKNADDLWSVRPRQKNTRYVFDRGPGPEVAKAIMTSLDREAIFAPKPGMQVIEKGRDVTFERNGIDAFNTKTHPGTGFFGIHRGSFTGSRALILADPHGIDDWNTARALTGARGQHLNGLMQDLGIGEKYLVIKTVPVGMDGATSEEWEVVRKKTEAYREVAIKEVLARSKFEVIFTDGDIAKKEMERILTKLKVKSIPVVNIERSASDTSSGIIKAGEQAKASIRSLSVGEIKGKMVDIPRSHLPWWARTWEGTSGDHVIDALGKHKGGVRALVTPDWVVKQEVKPLPQVLKSVEKLRAKMEAMGLYFGKEPIDKFVARKLQNRGRLGRIEAPAVGKVLPLRKTGKICAEIFSAPAKVAPKIKRASGQ